MIKKGKLFHLLYSRRVIIFLLLFAGMQFFLLLRHKSPYLSDSHFYRHIFYNFKGFSFSQSYQKVVEQINLDSVDEISKNFYSNITAYKNSLSFFTKRPLYPFLAFIISFLINNEYTAFLIPVFVAYLGCIMLTFILARYGLTFFFACLTTALVIAFYPFLDWSTYFITDTIGAFFWLVQIWCAYRFIVTSDRKFLRWFTFFLILSLFNREQSLLMSVLFLLLFLLLLWKQAKIVVRRQVRQLMIVSIIVLVAYMVVSTLLGQKTLLDTINYMQNSYGLDSKTYTLGETLRFMSDAIYRSHLAFLKDLSQHHWWLVIVSFAAIEIIYSLAIAKKYQLFDLFMISSGFASYIAIFLYPMLSYRYFIPLLVMISYFGSKFIERNCLEKK